MELFPLITNGPKNHDSRVATERQRLAQMSFIQELARYESQKLHNMNCIESDKEANKANNPQHQMASTTNQQKSTKYCKSKTTSRNQPKAVVFHTPQAATKAGLLQLATALLALAEKCGKITEEGLEIVGCRFSCFLGMICCSFVIVSCIPVLFSWWIPKIKRLGYQSVQKDSFKKQSLRIMWVLTPPFSLKTKAIAI